MQEGVINLETAKLAYEKGFRERQSTYFDSEGELAELYECYCHDVNSCSCGAIETYDAGKDAIQAPTHALLQKWLREQRTPIIVTPVTDFVAWEVEIDHPDKGTIIIAKNREDRWFNSYEEALEMGLHEALKLI
jgi:hypothetical protein